LLHLQECIRKIQFSLLFPIEKGKHPTQRRFKKLPPALRMLWYTLPFLELAKIKSPEEYLIAEPRFYWRFSADWGSFCWFETQQSREENYWGKLFSRAFCSLILPFSSQGGADSVTHCSPCSGSQSDFGSIYRPLPSHRYP